MTAKKTTAWKCKCERCQYEWTTKTDTLPKVCARCANPNWNKPKKPKG